LIDYPVLRIFDLLVSCIQVSAHGLILNSEQIVLFFVDSAQLFALSVQRPVFQLHVVLHYLVSGQQTFVICRERDKQLLVVPASAATAPQLLSSRKQVLPAATASNDLGLVFRSGRGTVLLIPSGSSSDFLELIISGPETGQPWLVVEWSPRLSLEIFLIWDSRIIDNAIVRTPSAGIISFSRGVARSVGLFFF
jgi:hypothetical protein